MFFHLSSLLVCLHPFLPSGLPISSCFSPIFLLSCIASQPLSSGRSSFFCPPSLFLLFDEPSCSHKLVSRPHRHADVTHALITFHLSFFLNCLSNMTPSTFLQALAPACIRRRPSTPECPSSITILPRYTKPNTCLISLPSNLMFNCSLSGVLTNVYYELTRFPSKTTSSRWQVDKEAICLLRVQQFHHLDIYVYPALVRCQFYF